MDKSAEILVVDDNKELAYNLKDILQEEDYDVSIAINGIETTARSEMPGIA